MGREVQVIIDFLILEFGENVWVYHMIVLYNINVIYL